MQGSMSRLNRQSRMNKYVSEGYYIISEKVIEAFAA